MASKSLLNPVCCAPVALLSSQRQMIAVAMNEIAIGNRKTPRKKPSPLMPRSRSKASRNPTTSVPPTKTSVKTTTLATPSRKRVSSARRV
jgi:hypothetical protein